LGEKRGTLIAIETYHADNQEQLAHSLIEFVSDNLGKRPLFF
jgi:hypothetical protein